MSKPQESMIEREQPEVEKQGNAECNPEEAQQPRRSQRIKTLTEKGKEMQEGKVKGLQQ